MIKIIFKLFILYKMIFIYRKTLVQASGSAEAKEFVETKWTDADLQLLKTESEA